MKKIIILLLFTIILTGCEASYDLEIKDNKLNETINFTNPIDQNKKQEIKDFLDTDAYVFTNTEDTLKKYNIMQTANGYKLNYTYDANEFANVALLNNCFDSFQYNNTDEYIAIKIQGKFACLYDVPNIKVRLKTDYNVAKQNADIVEDGYYIWNINSFTSSDMDIEFTVLKGQVAKPAKKGNFFVNFLATLLIVGIMVAGGFFMNFVLKKIDSF